VPTAAAGALRGKAGLGDQGARGPTDFDGRAGYITVHPSYLLRIPDPDAKGGAAYKDFVRGPETDSADRGVAGAMNGRGARTNSLCSVHRRPASRRRRPASRSVRDVSRGPQVAVVYYFAVLPPDDVRLDLLCLRQDTVAQERIFGRPVAPERLHISIAPLHALQSDRCPRIS